MKISRETREEFARRMVADIPEEELINLAVQQIIGDISSMNPRDLLKEIKEIYPDLLEE